MQPAGISYEGQGNSVASGGEDDEEEGCTGGAETLVEEESRMQQDKISLASQVDAISLEVHGSTAGAETSTGLSKWKRTDSNNNNVVCYLVVAELSGWVV